MIFRKALELPDEQMPNMVGIEILAKDVESLVSDFPNCHDGWTSLVQALACGWLLWESLGATIVIVTCLLIG